MVKGKAAMRRAAEKNMVVRLGFWVTKLRR